MILLALVYMLTGAYREKGHKLLKVVQQLAGGFLIGIVMAWLIVIVPSGWKLPIWETMYAGSHADIYGHEVEHAAEQYSLFMFFVGNISTIVTGSVVWMLKKRRLRPIDVA
jgi:hypothetical protein